MTLKAEKESMAYAERLPLTLGKGGWKGQGEKSLAYKVRMLVNLPGYLLIAGADGILGVNKSNALHKLYHKYRSDFEESLWEYKEQKNPINFDI